MKWLLDSPISIILEYVLLSQTPHTFEDIKMCLVQMIILYKYLNMNTLMVSSSYFLVINGEAPRVTKPPSQVVLLALLCIFRWMFTCVKNIASDQPKKIATVHITLLDVTCSQKKYYIRTRYKMLNNKFNYW